MSGIASGRGGTASQQWSMREDASGRGRVREVSGRGDVRNHAPVLRTVYCVLCTRPPPKGGQSRAGTLSLPTEAGLNCAWGIGERRAVLSPSVRELA